MRFAVTEQCGHLFHARMSCAEDRRITTSRATGYASPLSPSSSLIFPFLVSIALQIDASPIFDRVARCFDTVLLTTVLSSLSDEPLRFPHAVLSLIPPRAVAVSLAPNRACASSLLPPARADHVLFSRSPPSGMRPSAATVRNSCCACVKN